MVIKVKLGSNLCTNNSFKIINKAIEKGISGVVLGFTEIPLLIKQSDVAIDI